MSEKPIALAKNGAASLLARLEDELAAGRIDEARWYREVAAVITPAYLAGTSPRAQSGHSGDANHFRAARELVLDAMDRDGGWLDVGCANGHLMECMVEWAAARGRVLDPWGVDIAPELVALARTRLPAWRDRFFVGNAIDWMPPRRFEFVRTGLEYVPTRRRGDLVGRLLREVVAPGGRLVIGTYNEEIDELREEPSLAEQLADLGFVASGRTERPHRSDARLRYRALWIDAR